jgi:hypothetical protein
MFNLKDAEHDVVLSSGPSYATRRQEAREAMQAFVQASPDLARYVMDLIAQNSDWPGAQEFAARFKRVLSLTAPGVLSDEQDGQPEDPRLPALQQQMEQMGQMLQQLQAEVQDKREDRLSKERIAQGNRLATILATLAKIDPETAQRAGDEALAREVGADAPVGSGADGAGEDDFMSAGANAAGANGGM